MANEPPPVVRCQAYRQNDEMFCPRCNRRWTSGDNHPPDCPARITPADPFVARVCKAFEITPSELAQRIGVKPKELDAIMGFTRADLPEMMYSDELTKLAGWVDRMYAACLVAQSELAHKREYDARERMRRHAETRRGYRG